MKKILVLAFLAVFSITPVYAEGGRGGGHYEGHGGGWGGFWIIPALIGGAILYDLSQPRTVYTEPAPIYVEPVPAYAPDVAAPSVQNWYFCAASNTYYPYVRSCPSGWQAVPTTPPADLPNSPYVHPPK